MTNADDDLGSELFSLVEGGPTYRLVRLLGLNQPGAPRRLLKVLALLSLTWLPVFVLSWIAGHAFAGEVKVPFLRDLETNGRLLAALPLLELAAGVIGISLAVQARSFLVMDLVPARQRSEFAAAWAASARLRESGIAEGILVVLSYGASIGFRLGLELGAGDSSWERVGSALTLAGWWHTLVSLPVLYFLLLRWAWVLFLWAMFLFRVSRLDLEVTATHPDRVGGLGFLAWGVVSFAPLLTAVAALQSAGLAEEVFHRGILLADLKYDIGACVIVSLFIVYVPLLFFFPLLARCRFRGLLDFGNLILDHDRDFETKWVEQGADHRRELLGSSDISSMADAGVCYEHINEMWPVLFDIKAFAVLTIASLVPFAVLLGSIVPAKELFLRLGEMLI